MRIITNDADAVCKFSMKFGADMGTSLGLIDECMRLGLNLVGVSFHVGSGQMSPKAFTESIENARKLFDYARETHGCRMHLLDLGGGYPGSSDMMDLFDTVSMEINKSLNKHFPLDYFNESNGYSDEHRLRVIAAERNLRVNGGIVSARCRRTRAHTLEAHTCTHTCMRPCTAYSHASPRRPGG